MQPDDAVMTPLEAARHVGEDEVPWVPNPAYRVTWMRLVQADVDAGVYAMAGRLPAGRAVGTHRHVGNVHTLYVPDDNTEPTETLTIVYGQTEHADAGAVSDASTNRAADDQSCEAAGLPRPAAILR